MNTAPDPTPMGDEELAEIREALDSLDDAELEYSMPRDIASLLREVDRLRAELEDVTVEAGNQCRAAAARTVRAEKERDEAWSSYRRVNAELRDTVADRDALDAKITAVRKLRATWFQNADVVRGKADSIPGLTEVERAELRQGAVEMEHCARQVGHELGPTPEEEPGFVSKDLERRTNIRAALGETGGTDG